MKLNITKEWVVRMAELEDGCCVTAISPELFAILEGKDESMKYILDAEHTLLTELLAMLLKDYPDSADWKDAKYSITQKALQVQNDFRITLPKEEDEREEV